MRTSNGCWTCRLRRKKCDERRPRCDGCAALDVECHFDLLKRPEWMDGGTKQEEMAEQVKREIKEKGRRRLEAADPIPGTSSAIGEAPADQWVVSIPNVNPAAEHGMEMSPEASFTTPVLRPASCVASRRELQQKVDSGQSDNLLLAFYLDSLLPFLFPFYRPSLLEGGRAWVFELMMSSPVVRQATLCQSTYFFSLARETRNAVAATKDVLKQTTDAFSTLRQSLQVLNDAGITEHIHGAVRILASIMQLHHYEIAVSSFTNWQTHLGAALALFREVLESPANLVVDLRGPASRFNHIMVYLEHPPSSCNYAMGSSQASSAEISAFRFSASLLFFDDVIASTVLHKQPSLYDLHSSLIGAHEHDDVGVPINIHAIVGIENRTLVHLGEIAALDAWKWECRSAGNLDMMDLVHRATSIKDSLVTHLMLLEASPTTHKEPSHPIQIFDLPRSQSTLVSQVWSHAAIIYLSIVVSGWQPANLEVRYHVGRVLELLKQNVAPASLRTMAWPYCVAGCISEPNRKVHFREIAEGLQPPSIFSTFHKALEIMTNVWRSGDNDSGNRDLASCFRVNGEIVLLV
ncbi:fungal-specific transcription factor domain-domain-containing protein [Clohesyomyces aquaticus]|uniref:Fungal-specific transcription factor domain-domain-containing protein n=1 Tax=Clohesyomyces aquaticus TaxID=1231657 RepID=A0A1Y1ZUP0_9PLEO|nr:fungal-specific transcription factor domain-domain-containing protein [Clohesyomyces aquaticus]